MEFASFSIELLLLLFVVAIFAGLLDTLAGGGGLISIPALILSGIPPLAALGTNKLQGSMGTATATYILVKKNKINLPENCSGLMEPDTFMRENTVNHRGVNYDPKTQLQTVPERV